MSGAPATSPEMLRLPLDRLADPLPVPPLCGAFDVAITPPGSKSLTNRALLLAALASGESTLRGALTDAEDGEVMIRALRALGAGVEVDGATVRVRGVGGRFAARGGVAGAPLVLNLENAGTATRFLAAAALLADGPVVIDGNARMRQRPIGELADALAALSAKVEWMGARGCPPLRITPPPPAAQHPAMPREVTLATTSSGQFVSALMLVAPFLPGGLRVRLSGEPTSPPYIAMTLRLLSRLGAGAQWHEDLHNTRIEESRGGLAPFALDIEPDASGATYFWAAAALVHGAAGVTPGVGAARLQGDAHFPGLLEQMGATVEQSDASTAVRGGAGLGPIAADLGAMPDAALTLAALACFAGGASTIGGLGTLRVKETDRLAALRAELSKTGARVEIIEESGRPALRIEPPAGGVDCSPGAAPIVFETYDDHRMAMALALIGLRRPNVTIRNPTCVAKTYPGFWGDLAKLY